MKTIPPNVAGYLRRSLIIMHRAVSANNDLPRGSFSAQYGVQLEIDYDCCRQAASLTCSNGRPSARTSRQTIAHTGYQVVDDAQRTLDVSKLSQPHETG